MTGEVEHLAGLGEVCNRLAGMLHPGGVEVHQDVIEDDRNRHRGCGIIADVAEPKRQVELLGGATGELRERLVGIFITPWINQPLNQIISMVFLSIRYVQEDR